MKKSLILILIIICVFTLAGCGGIRVGDMDTRVYNTLEGVVMTVDEFSPDGGSYTIINNSEYAISFGADSCIQTERNGKWYSLEVISDEISIDTIGYSVEKGAQDTFSSKWSAAYGTLPDGHYRMVLSIVYGYRNEQAILAAEFTIETEK